MISPSDMDKWLMKVLFLQKLLKRRKLGFKFNELTKTTGRNRSTGNIREYCIFTKIQKISQKCSVLEVVKRH